MFKYLLNKILPKKKEQAPLVGRELHGRNNVGYPTMQLSREVDQIVKKYYRSVRPLFKYYKETMFFKWAPGVINSTLTDEQLEHLSGRNVQMVYLLLFRDMLRHISEHVTPINAPDNWADNFTQELIDNCQMLGDKDDKDISIKQQLLDELPLLDLTDENSGEQIDAVVALINMPAKDLYNCHRILTNSILKKVTKKKKSTKK